MTGQPTVYIVDDDAAIRQSLDLMLKNHYPVMTFPSAEAFLAEDHIDALGCVLLDLRMPGMDGLELQERLHVQGLDIPIVFMTGHGGVPECTQAFRNGAMHFIEKPFSAETLLASLDEAIEEAGRRVENHSSTQEFDVRLARLTERERQVMELLVDGRSNKEIGRALDISYRTVEKHRSEVFRKLDVSNAIELARLVS